MRMQRQRSCLNVEQTSIEVVEKKLRNLFRGYYQATPDEVTSIWSGGLVSLDANVLLSLYKVLPSTSNLYLGALEKRKEQMWLPYQTAAEFHRNVHAERSKQTNGHLARIKSIDGFLEELRKTAKKSRLQASKLQQEVEGKLHGLRDELEAERKTIADQTHHRTPDALLQRIADLFNGNVGSAPSQDDLKKLHEAAEKRFNEQIPPGYEDAKTKEGPRKFGDYILWRQVLDRAQELGRDFIFVTDDDKSDWWLKDDKKMSLAPRPELVQEFRAETGQEILILNSAQFYHHLVPDNTTDQAEENIVLAAREDMNEAVTEAQAESKFERLVLSLPPAEVDIFRARWKKLEADRASSRGDLSPLERSLRLDGEQDGIPSVRELEALLRAYGALRGGKSQGWRVNSEERLRHGELLRERLSRLRAMEAELTAELLGSNGLGSNLEHYKEGELRMRLAEIHQQQRDIEATLHKALGDDD